MPHRVTLRTLRRVHCVLRGSFLAYLAHAKPYVGPDDAEESVLLADLIERQDRLATRVASLIRSLGDEADLCDFPAEFTDAHDLSIRYALQRASENAAGDVQRLSQLRDELANPAAEQLMEEVIHEEAAILDQLEKAAGATASP